MLWRRVGRPLFIILVLIWTIRLTIADWRDVPSGSMEPTIRSGDRIMVNLLAYEFRVPFTDWRVAKWNDPSHGDVVVFRHGGARTMVKRVIAMPGDEVEVRGHHVWVNGVPAAYDWEEHPTRHEMRGDDNRTYETVMATETVAGHRHRVMFDTNVLAPLPFKKTVVPEGHYFVMGDNRDHSRDSRSIGFIPRDAILGRVYSVAFSFDVDDGYQMRRERWFRSVH